MKVWRAYWLMSVFLLLPACTQVQVEPQYDKFAQQEVYVPPGAYAEYGSVAQLRYYKSVLSPKVWQEVEVLDYSEKRFPFPPLAGYRMLHYKNPRRQIQIDLYREIIKKESFTDIIARRGASNHCNFTNSLYSKLYDIDIVEVTADCHVWLEGTYTRKYYFLKAGNVVYTFCLLSVPDDYYLAEPEFDYFVSTTIDNYLIYAPRRQFSPDSIYYASNTLEEEDSNLFSEEELISFFAPIAVQHMVAQ